MRKTMLLNKKFAFLIFLVLPLHKKVESSLITKKIKL